MSTIKYTLLHNIKKWKFCVMTPMSKNISDTVDDLITARSFNRHLAPSEIRNIVSQLDDINMLEIEYILAISIQFNEYVFATIVNTIEPRVGYKTMQTMIQDAVINANRSTHTNHSCPIFFQVHKIASYYLDESNTVDLDQSNHVDLCEVCDHIENSDENRYISI